MSNTQPIKVLLIDDQAAIRSAVEAFFWAFDDLKLVGEAANGQEAMQLCQQFQPDVLLLDILLFDMDELTTIQAIHKHYPNLPVIGIACFENSDLVQQALESGLLYYLFLDASAEDLAASIRTACGARSGSKQTVAFDSMQAPVNLIAQPVMQDASAFIS